MNNSGFNYFQLPWSLIWRSFLGMLLATLTVMDLNTLSFDTRLKLSPLAHLNTEIRLVRVSPFDTSHWQKGRNIMGSHSIFYDASDDYFWDEQMWADLLNKTLKSNPKKIGVALFLGNSPIAAKNEDILADPRIIWAVPKRVESNDLPSQTSYDRSNVGEINLTEDSDGKIRRYSISQSEMGDFFEKLSDLKKERQLNPKSIKLPMTEKEIPIIDAHLILSEHNETLEDLKGKIVVFGRSLNESNLVFQTPLGSYSKLGISGILLHNFLSHSWIKVFNRSIYILYFALIALSIVWLISRYPHKVALIFLIFLGLILSLISVYLFDVHNIWLPITAIWVQITTTWILFLGYSLNRMELSTLKLKEEKKLHQELEELKINFVSLISHDLKTPIAKIQAVTSRLKNQALAPDFRDDLSKIEKYSKELNRYIRNVLKLLQVETSKFKLNIDSVDINLLIKEITLELGPLASEKAITFDLDLAPMFSVDGDQQLMREVFLNLIQNALQYSHSNSQVRIETSDENDVVKVKIIDNGIGISPDEIPFLFEKFYRGKNSSISQQGSGLGLYLVKYFIELHDGRVHVESKLQSGTIFTLWLPVEQKKAISETSEAEGEYNG